jgi:hypothetical protein
MIEGGTPFLARDVAPPALRDWPVVSESKKCRKHLMKKDLVGMVPLLVSHSGGLRGNLSSHIRRYERKCLWGSKMWGFFWIMTVFPSKNQLALWPGRNS